MLDPCPFGHRGPRDKKGECALSYLDGDPNLSQKYNALRITCAVVGMVGLLACICKLYILRRVGGSSIQHQVYILLIVSSVAFIARSVDPMSYATIYPVWISGLLCDVSSACLYTIMILYAAFYARVVVNPIDIVKYDFFIQGFRWLMIFLTWATFVGVRSIYLWSNPGQGTFQAWHILMQYSMGPILLFIISSTALYFGLHIYRRLKIIHEANERTLAIAAARKRAAASSCTQSPTHPPSPGPILLSDDAAATDEMNHGIDMRILRVLILTELYALGVIGLQVHLSRAFRFPHPSCRSGVLSPLSSMINASSVKNTTAPSSADNARWAFLSFRLSR
ncbi:hypothetical protein AC1031_017272 [Aphanomyces cochlioides]|nr:hypothetical protein AC1031_017272 [Aphanomyces cochlioides]